MSILFETSIQFNFHNPLDRHSNVSEEIVQFNNIIHLSLK